MDILLCLVPARLLLTALEIAAGFTNIGVEFVSKVDTRSYWLRATSRWVWSVPSAGGHTAGITIPYVNDNAVGFFDQFLILSGSGVY
jgi:hypothetical protein